MFSVIATSVSNVFCGIFCVKCPEGADVDN